jgi:phosphatidylglycerol---prolipoprotein diacylglyceryl transferase
MHPVLFEFGQFTLYWYGVLLAAAYLLGLQFALWRARRRGLDPQRVMDLGILVIVTALIGAKLLLLVVDFRQFTASPSAMFGLLRSGGVFYGGLIAAVPASLLYLRWKRMPLWTTTDVFAPGITLGHVVGRLGCLMAGCCFGRQTSVPLHPTQLYDAGAELLILAVLLLWERRSTGFPGRTFWSYMLLYGVTRFIIEFYRGDSRGMVFDALSTSQFVAVLLVPLSVLMLFLLRRRTNPTRHSAAQRVAA